MSETTEENRGARVLKARKAIKGMTQGRLADLVGLSQQTIGQIEKHNATSTRMYKIAEVLLVNINYLETGKSSPNLSIIENELETFTIEDIQDVFEDAFDSALISTRKTLQRQGHFEDGVIDAVKNKKTLLNIFIAAITHKLTGQYMESNIILNREDKIS